MIVANVLLLALEILAASELQEVSRLPCVMQSISSLLTLLVAILTSMPFAKPYTRDQEFQSFGGFWLVCHALCSLRAGSGQGPGGYRRRHLAGAHMCQKPSWG